MERGSARRVLREIYSVDDINAYFAEFATEANDARGAGMQLRQLRDEFALLAAMVACEPDRNRVLLVFEPLAGLQDKQLDALHQLYRELCQAEFDFDSQPVEDAGTDAKGSLHKALVASGACAGALLEGEAGLHVFVGPDDSLSAVQLHVLPLPEGEEPAAKLKQMHQSRRAWMTKSTDKLSTDNEPQPIGKVLRVFRAGQGALDLRTRLTSDEGLPATRLREMMLGGLPSPTGWEVTDAIS